MEFSECNPEEFDALIDCLDREFIYSRNRQSSLRGRFPKLLGASANCHVARDRGRIVSSLAAQKFEISVTHSIYRGVMLGLIWTDPGFRRRGHARDLIEHYLDSLSREGIDFAVLWTSRPELYSGSGWQASDCGVYGEYIHTPTDSTRIATTLVNWAEVARIRGQYAALPARIPGEYRANLPPFAGSIDVVLAGDAYAILGINNDSAVILDFEGNARSFDQVWPLATRGRGKIHINVAASSPAANWLKQALNVELHPKTLAMWRRITTASNALDFTEIYIPFADRI